MIAGKHVQMPETDQGGSAGILISHGASSHQTDVAGVAMIVDKNFAMPTLNRTMGATLDVSGLSIASKSMWDSPSLGMRMEYANGFWRQIS
jgi:hypothetical protein